MAAPRVAVWRLVHVGVHLVLEDVQVVGGRDGDDVLGRVPGRVQDLFGEVQAVHADVVPPPLAAHAHAPRLEHRPGLAALPRRLQGHIPLGVPVKHAEEVVVGPGHDDAGGRRSGVRRGNGRGKPAPPPGAAGPWPGKPTGDTPASSHLLLGSLVLPHISAASAHRARN